MKLNAVGLAFVSAAGVFVVSLGLLLTGGPGNIFAGDNREDSAGSDVTNISAACDADGTWQAYAAVSVDIAKSNGAVVVSVSDADTIAITDAVVDNGYVDGTPPRIAPGVADILFKDGGAATNDPILLEMTAPRGVTAVSNFVTPIKVNGNTVGIKAFREAPTKTRKNVAVTVSGTCE